MMVFFPTRICEFDFIAARTSSSQTNPTGLFSFFGAGGFGGSSSVYEASGGAHAAVAVVFVVVDGAGPR